MRTFASTFTKTCFKTLATLSGSDKEELSILVVEKFRRLDACESQPERFPPSRSSAKYFVHDLFRVISFLDVSHRGNCCRCARIFDLEDKGG